MFQSSLTVLYKVQEYNRNTEIPSSQHGKTHNVCHPIKDYLACQEAGKS